MINEFLSKLKGNNDAKRLGGDFLFLFIINISNFVFPIITFPYLISVLGVEGFGVINFALAIVVYFTLITEYGFNLTATRDIAIHRKDPFEINQIFSKVIYSKIILSVICFVVFLLLIYFVPKINAHFDVFLVTYLSIFGQIFIPIWLFQGFEKMKLISSLFFVSKLISTLLIFIFIKNSSDILLVPLINFLSFSLISIISTGICLIKYQIKFIAVPFKEIYDYAKDGFHIFISNISVAFFSTGTITILGLMTNNTIVGYYSAADKIIQAIRTLLNTLSQILFPYLSKLSLENSKKVYQVNGKLIRIGVPLMSIFTLILFLFSGRLLSYLTNTQNQTAEIIMKIMSFIPLISFVHIILAMFILLVFKKNKDYSIITLTSGVLNLMISALMIYFFQAIGAAITIVVVEVFSAVLYIRSIKKNNLQIFP